jgi:HAD superfamily hydrolase (TIGR01456 family)
VLSSQLSHLRIHFKFSSLSPSFFHLIMLSRMQPAVRRACCSLSLTLHLRTSVRFSTHQSSPRSTPAIVFDIDGVLLRGKQLLPTARTALRKVTRLEDGGTHPDGGLPHVYLTNGGGMLEAAKAQQLSELFDLRIPADAIVQSHTPMQSLLPLYQDKLVLAVGHSREGVRKVAANYGFKHLLIPEDLMHKYPHSVPHLTDSGMPALREPPVTHYDNELDSIASIFVMHDPLEWYRDMQICLDILVHQRQAGNPAPTIYFSNPDFLFSGTHHTPRLAAGAFRIALCALYKEYTGQELQYVLFGKPYPVTYQYAEKLLKQQAASQGKTVGHIYGIGDNPASDIRGANAAGSHWSSILVRTGNIPFSKLPEEQPKYEVECVEAAVDLILQKEKERK